MVSRQTRVFRFTRNVEPKFHQQAIETILRILWKGILHIINHDPPEACRRWDQSRWSWYPSPSSVNSLSTSILLIYLNPIRRIACYWTDAGSIATKPLSGSLQPGTLLCIKKSIRILRYDVVEEVTVEQCNHNPHATPKNLYLFLTTVNVTSPKLKFEEVLKEGLECINTLSSRRICCKLEREYCYRTNRVKLAFYSTQNWSNWPVWSCC